MGTVPAPNIVADVQAGQQGYRDSLEEYARSVGLEHQAAILGAQQQQQDIQTKQMQQQLADQQAMTKALHDWDGKDFSQLPELAKKNGMSGPAYLQAQQQVLARKKEILSYDDAQVANLQKHHDIALGAIDAAEGVPDDELMQHIGDTVGRLQAAGHIDQNTGQNIITHAQSMPPDQFRPWLDVYKKSLLAESALLAQKKTQAETEEATAKAGEATAKGKQATQGEWHPAQELGLEVNSATGETRPLTGGNGAPVMTPAQIESKYLALQQRENAGLPNSKEDAAWKKAVEKYKTLVPVANFNLQNAGAAADSNGNPSEIARAIAENRMKWSEAVSPRTPQSVKNAIMAQVYKLNPNYDTAEFGLETEAAKKARSGAWADSRLAYNTALDHSDMLLEAAKALQNGDVRALNTLKNKFNTAFGGSGQITFNAIANAYNHEVNSVISKGHTTDAEIATGHATLPDNANYQTLASVVGAYKGLMTSKRDELDKIVKAAAGGKANSVINTGSSSAQGGHIIKIGTKRYQYKGSGDTADLSNYNELPATQ